MNKGQRGHSTQRSNSAAAITARTMAVVTIITSHVLAYNASTVKCINVTFHSV